MQRRLDGKFLAERIHTTNHRKMSLTKDVMRTKRKLARRLNWNDYDSIIHKSELCAEVTFVSTRQYHIYHIGKFNRLKKKSIPEQS